MTWSAASSRGRRPSGLGPLPCFSLMDSDVSMHDFLHWRVRLVVVIALISWWNRP
jgi:hypothetical protein